MKRVLRDFGGGLLVVVPAAVSIYVVVRLFRWVDSLITVPNPWGEGHLPGMGVVVVLLGITAVGALARGG